MLVARTAKTLSSFHLVIIEMNADVAFAVFPYMRRRAIASKFGHLLCPMCMRPVIRTAHIDHRTAGVIVCLLALHTTSTESIHFIRRKASVCPFNNTHNLGLPTQLDTHTHTHSLTLSY